MSEHQVLRTEVRELPVRLAPDELRERGQKMAQLKADLEEHKRESKEASKERKDKENALESAISSIARAIREKEEKRPVDVEIRFVGTGRVAEVRVDLGTVLLERMLDKDEAQVELPVSPGDA